jgi:bacteriocin biosynthesis cyclodehydratase domain-containing protein
MSHFPPIVRVGPLYVPGLTGCYSCQEASYRASHPLYDEAVDRQRGRRLEASTFGPACAIVGGYVATDVVHHLTELCPAAGLGAMRIIDLRTFGATTEEVPRRPTCHTCGEERRE